MSDSHPMVEKILLLAEISQDVDFTESMKTLDRCMEYGCDSEHMQDIRECLTKFPDSQDQLNKP